MSTPGSEDFGNTIPEEEEWLQGDLSTESVYKLLKEIKRINKDQMYAYHRLLKKAVQNLKKKFGDDEVDIDELPKWVLYMNEEALDIIEKQIEVSRMKNKQREIEEKARKYDELMEQEELKKQKTFF